MVGRDEWVSQGNAGITCGVDRGERDRIVNVNGDGCTRVRLLHVLRALNPVDRDPVPALLRRAVVTVDGVNRVRTQAHECAETREYEPQPQRFTHDLLPTLIVLDLTEVPALPEGHALVDDASGAFG